VSNLSALAVAMLEPDADRNVLASLADYDDHLDALLNDGGELARLSELCQFSEQIAVGGQDGDKIESLMSAAQKEGAATLARLSTKALARAMRRGPAAFLRRSGRFFDFDELCELQEVFAKAAAMADLLGRSRIRLRAAKAEQYSEDELTDWSCFATTAIKPLAPMDALEYFRKLVPRLGIDPEHFGPRMYRTAFTMSEASSTTILKKCQKVIADLVASGEAPRKGRLKIQRILEKAGVTPGEGYAEMVVRTNVGEIYRHSMQEEFLDPDLRDTFPCWRFLGVQDGRERHGPLPHKPDHRRWFGKYFSRDVLFADVRGREARDVCNCVLPGNQVHGNIRAMSKSWYSGDAFEVKMASGVLFTVTRNHPIFTEDRLTAACHLQKGMKTWSHFNQNHFLADCNIDQAPALIEDVFDSLPPGLDSKPVSRLDFHGDGEFIKSDVHEIRTNRNGLLARYLHRAKPLDNVALESALDGRMSSVDLAKPLILRHHGPLEGFGLGLVAGSYSHPEQSPSYSPTTGAEFNCQGVLGHVAVSIKSAQFVIGKENFVAFSDRDLASPFRHGSMTDAELGGYFLDVKTGADNFFNIGRHWSSRLQSDFSIVFQEETFHCPVAYARFICQLTAAYPRHVFLDKVVSVKRFHHEGPVYNVETNVGYFTIGNEKGIAALSKNCRCDMQPISKYQWARLKAKGARLSRAPS